MSFVPSLLSSLCFASIPEYADTFGVKHANVLISLSQLSETFCLLLIPFALKRFGIKYVMLISMLCWVLRFALFGWGNPGSGVWMFVLSMIVYGIAFDFFNISGSLFVNQETDMSIRSSAQGLFMMMTNGVGATIGTILAQQVVNHYVDFSSQLPQVEGWSRAWMVFAGYMLVVAVLFAFMFKYSERPGTFAQRNLGDDIPEDVKTRRLTEIIDLQNKLSEESNKRDIGKEFEILVECTSKRSDAQLSGRTSQNKMVVFDKGNHKVGDYVKVRITGCSSATLFGEEIA